MLRPELIKECTGQECDTAMHNGNSDARLHKNFKDYFYTFGVIYAADRININNLHYDFSKISFDLDYFLLFDQ